MRKLLVPVDGSAVANRAVIHAIDLARGMGETRLVLLNVQQSLEHHYAHGLQNQEAIADLKRRGQEAAAEAIAVLDRSGLLYDFEVVFGHPAEVVARIAKEQRCNGIVMGTRGMGDVESVFLGSTAHKVIELAVVPVTLVK